ncbi:DNA circularization N-terminal domain-containing protein [Sodalis sp. dw_96]|uniref:DNA circularization protein n=1 Tax=Sodalis sp. dw_96 TaxID=2719794 RepID=UPI001BD1EBA7|nr:DNA circularization N-terminal domain-containing protein [Sodalis sp. dw_96]
MSILSDELSSLLGGSGDSWIWSDHLHAASFRGVPFAVTTGDGEFGRRQAVHEYPFRDSVWVEDLGRSTRKLTLRGFIIQSSLLYTAGDVMTQRDSLVAACETSGPGTLIHPTLGELTVSIPAGGLKITEGPAGRVFEFTLTVIESGLKVFALTDAASATSTVTTSYLSLVSKIAATFISEVKGDLRTVTQAIKTLKSTGKFWSSMVTSTADEATNLNNTLKSTFGSTRYGRYENGDVGGSVSGTTGNVSTTADTDDYDGLVAEKIATSIENRAAIDASTAALLDSTTIEAYSANAQAIADAINSGIASLSDLIRVWESLAAFTDTTYRPAVSDSGIAAAANYYFVVLAAGAMANAAAQYSPSSYDDAMNVLARVIAVIDSVTLTVANTGYDDVYREMQALREAVVTTLQSTGANLADVQPMNFSRSLPALYLANRLYQDAARAESLMKMADPVHPAFMPTSFKALTS